MKGIILAGGTGTRLYPLTTVISKQLLPVYDKPMVYYPLSTLMLADIQDILLISTPQDLPSFQMLLGDGSQFGIKLTYLAQPLPEGLAQAFILGRDFIGDDCCAMILGDNLFYGNGFRALLRQAANTAGCGEATVFGYYVSNPENYGNLVFDDNGQVKSIEEKPVHPKSNYCVPGLYFYDNRVVNYAWQIQPSARGELEITDLNRRYMEDGSLRVQILGRGYTWLDAGTIDGLSEAGDFIRTIEKKQGILISAPEEIAYINGWIDIKGILEAAELYGNSPYGAHLIRVAEGKIRY